MCGIAGIIDLSGQRPVEPIVLERMGKAIAHRGPDEFGYLREPGLGFASRRLSIIDLDNGRQPIYNEDRSVAVVYNGELFDYREQRTQLENCGHRFRTSCDTEILVHLWEEHGEDMIRQLRGQFAFALVDLNQRLVILGRDRVGICPLFWAKRDGWLYFGSEIKALIASDRIDPRVDERGIDHIFSFFGMSSRRTMFRDVSAVYQGSYLKIALPTGSDTHSSINERFYWDLQFPDANQEEDPKDPADLVEQFGDVLTRAVKLRLRADVPVASYLSGGVDSTTVAALASRAKKTPVDTYTIQIDSPGLDETDRATLAAQSMGSHQTMIRVGAQEISKSYPALIVASETPVIDTSAAALHMLAGTVQQQGLKVVLTGEGADEALAGYPWFKANKFVSVFDKLGIGQRMRSGYFPRVTLGEPWEQFRRRYDLLGGFHATSELYAMCSLSGYHLYSKELRDQLQGFIAPDDIVLNLDRMKRWHPINRSLYLGYKIMLPGVLMTHKGDRPAMNNSVEARFPFLDEELIDFCASISPRFKLKGLFRDKDLLRRYASRLLPAKIADRPKSIFRAPMSGAFLDNAPAYVDQLLSSESLTKTGYFDTDTVSKFRLQQSRFHLKHGSHKMREMGLVGVITTQLWHHLFLGGGLCELPVWSPPSIAHRYSAA